MSNAERQRQFVPLFYFAVTMDALAAMAAASRDEALSHLSMLWTGPLDNIVYGLAGFQALLFLLDPTGSKILDDKGHHSVVGTAKLAAQDAEMQQGLASRFLLGSQMALHVLAIALLGSLVSALVLPDAISSGLADIFQRHLACLLPIATVVGGGVAFLTQSKRGRDYGIACLMGAAAVTVVAVKQGRIENYLYHMVANLESLYAWCLVLCWSAFFVDRSQAKESSPAEA